MYLYTCVSAAFDFVLHFCFRYLTSTLTTCVLSIGVVFLFACASVLTQQLIFTWTALIYIYICLYSLIYQQVTTSNLYR